MQSVRTDKSGLMNTDDKASVLIQIVTIRAVTGVATLSRTDLISVLLNAVTDHAFSRVYAVATKTGYFTHPSLLFLNVVRRYTTL